MPGDLLFRTEDFDKERVLSCLVAKEKERQVIDSLKGRTPVLLKGSRGVGKTFLLHAARAELENSFSADHVLPVYVAFPQAGLIRVESPDEFLNWMIAKIYNQLMRAVTWAGLKLPDGAAITALQGTLEASGSTHLEQVESVMENSWRKPKERRKTQRVPDPEIVRDSIEDLCRETSISRVVLMVDEAAHVFIPDQQRQFFAMMRDLRSPYVSVKAAIYPGVTSFGEAFQPSHDALIMSVDRNVTDREYLDAMRDIVTKQDPSLSRNITHNGEEFDALAFAATGNPRILIKTLSSRPNLGRKNVQETIRSYYREDIWRDHSDLAEKYTGYRDLIEWGRTFVEQIVLKGLRDINYRRKDASSYLWIHRNAPQPVHDALRLLCYSGILHEGVSGVRAHDGTGSRYLVSLGCHIALDDDPVKYATMVRRTLSTSNKVEFGQNHEAYEPIESLNTAYTQQSGNAVLTARLKAPSSVLDLSPFQRGAVAKLGLKTIGDILAAEDAIFTRVKWIGKARTRQIKNAAQAAVYEYLSG